MTEFEVLRQHLGDRMYLPGETREAKEADVSHLVRNGVLKASGAKAAPALQNKAEPKPANKAEPKVANKAEPKPDGRKAD